MTSQQSNTTASDAGRAPVALVTGSAGFIGYHLCRHLLNEGFRVVGVDAMTPYYDVTRKHRLHAKLRSDPNFSAEEFDIRDADRLMALAGQVRPDAIVHLAAQAGVRYSIEEPRTYVETNVVGTFNVMECARTLATPHLLMASTSSVYGASRAMPYRESQMADRPLTIYAATKKATEAMGHSYAHLWSIPTTMFRFFTVYGPWGRPDMAPVKFARAILAGQPIDVYNHGAMYRDFTYVGDLVHAIRLLIDVPPPVPGQRDTAIEGDSLSDDAPFRIVNIGNGTKVRLEDLITAIEQATGRSATRNNLPMQPGDVPATWADNGLLRRLTGYAPRTGLDEGIAAMVAWYREHMADGGS